MLRQWIRPYIIVEKHGRVLYDLRSEVENRIVKAHANRREKINQSTVEIEATVDGVFQNGIFTLGKKAECETPMGNENRVAERWFRLQIGGRNSPKMPKGSDL